MDWIVAGIFALIAVTVAVRAHLRLRSITGTPTTPVGSVREGRVEVEGRVSSRSRLIRSPLSHERCAYFRLRIEEKDSEGYWQTIVDDWRAKRLVVEDGTGAVLVDPDQAEVVLRTSHRSRSGVLDDPTRAERRVLRKRGLTAEHLGFNRKLRYTESILKVGDELYVLGSARADAGEPVIGAGQAPFLVADRSERVLTRRYRLERAGGALVVVAIVLVMLHQKGYLG